MAGLTPGSFDIILCLGIFYHTVRQYEFFEQFYRLRPRHIILNTVISKAEGAAVHFRYENDDDTLRPFPELPGLIVGLPTHGMIAILCEHFHFAWHMVDWTSSGIKQWDSVSAYQGDYRRTYVLSRVIP